jgi:hypothetical protein
VNIHDQARALSAQRQIPLADAYAELSRRAAVKRRRFKPLGVLHPTRADRSAFDHVEQPVARMWWNDPDR